MPTDDGWEARMAERAKARAAAALTPQIAGDGWSQWHRQQRAAALADLASMTLDEATDRLRRPPYGCACPGPPVCCWEYAAFARRLQHTAQQVANHFAALIDLRERGVSDR